MPSQTIAELEADVEERRAAMYAAWDKPAFDFTEGEWRGAKHKGNRKALAEFDDLLSQTVEMKYFIAKRRLTLARCAIPDRPTLCKITVKTSPDRFGVVMVFTFYDRLAAIDPRNVYDAEFWCDERALDIYKAMSNPHAYLRHFRAMNPDVVLGADHDDWPTGQEHADAHAEHKRLRNLLYPTTEARKAAMDTNRRPFTPAEAQETLRALYAHQEGDPPTVEQKLRGMKLDDVTPSDAHTILRQLKAQADRLADSKEFLPVSLGGTYLPPSLPDKPSA